MTSIALALSSTPEATDPSRWQRVRMPYPDKERVRHLDRRTGDLYLDEPVYVIALKCALIALASPLYTFSYMCWNAVRLVLNVCSSAKKAFSSLVEGEGRQEAFRIVSQELPEQLGTDFLNIVKAPFFGIVLAPVSLYGIFNPLLGRAMIAHLEFLWQDGVSYKQDIRKWASQNGESKWVGPKAFYFAWCFQPRGNIHDSRTVQPCSSEDLDCASDCAREMPAGLRQMLCAWKV